MRVASRLYPIEAGRATSSPATVHSNAPEMPGATAESVAEPAVASCLPNIATREDLTEFAQASEKNELTQEELLRVESVMLNR